MRKGLFYVLLVGCLVLCACAPAEEGGEETAAPDETAEAAAAVDPTAEVRDFAAKWQSTYNAADAEGLAALYAEDAVRFTDNEMQEGRDAIREGFVTFLEQNAGAQADVQVAKVQASGDRAYGQGTWSLTFTSEDGAEQVVNGKWLGVFDRQADGSWLFRLDSSNGSAPPPAQEGGQS